MKILKKIFGLTSVSIFACTILINSVSLAAPMRITPRAIGQENGSCSRLEVSCTSQVDTIKYTNLADKSCYCEAIGYMYDKYGNEIDPDTALFCSGYKSSGASISDSEQRSDVYRIDAYANLYDGTSAGYARIDHVEVKLGR